MRGLSVRFYATPWVVVTLTALALAAPLAMWSGSFARTPGGGPAQHQTLPQGSPAVQGMARVIDGDTIEIAGTRIRLEGIDAPEGDQACARAGGGTWHCGQVASSELQRLIGRAPVRCESRGTDRYGRMLGVCFVGATDINAEMVRRGLAWAFVKYSRAYMAEEAEARARGAGIWQAPTTAAWDHRARRWSAAGHDIADAGGCPIKGNITANGRIYHMPWSPWYDQIRVEEDKGKRWFCTEAEALAAGWRPVHIR